MKVRGILKSNLFKSVLIFIIVSLVSVFAGNVIVKDGNVDVGNLNVNGSLCNSTGSCFTLSELNNSASDNLGNHIATQSLNMNGFSIYNLFNVNGNSSAITLTPKKILSASAYCSGPACTDNTDPIGCSYSSLGCSYSCSNINGGIEAYCNGQSNGSCDYSYCTDGGSGYCTATTSCSGDVYACQYFLGSYCDWTGCSGPACSDYSNDGDCTSAFGGGQCTWNAETYQQTNISLNASETQMQYYKIFNASGTLLEHNYGPQIKYGWNVNNILMRGICQLTGTPCNYIIDFYPNSTTNANYGIVGYAESGWGAPLYPSFVIGSFTNNANLGKAAPIIFWAADTATNSNWHMFLEPNSLITYMQKLYMKGNIVLQSGSTNSTIISTDGTNTKINSTSGDVYILNNTGLGTIHYGRAVTSTGSFDKSSGIALDKIKDASSYFYTDKSGKAQINDSVYGDCAVTEIIYPYTKKVFTKEMTCKKTGKEAMESVCWNITVIKDEPDLSLPVTQTGVDVECLRARYEQAIYELKIKEQDKDKQITSLNQTINDLKSIVDKLCSNNQVC